MGDCKPTPAPARIDVEAITALTFEHFSAVNRERCESPNGFNHQLASWSTSDWFLAVVGELGEAANVAKKLNRIRDGIPGNKETEPALREKLRCELGDAFVYLDLLAQALEINIGDAAVDVFNAKSDELGCSIKMDVAARALPLTPYDAPDHQDVLPWLDEAVADWEVHKNYRPDSHYLLLFKGAANEIRQLRAKSKSRPSPPSLTPSEKELT